MNSVEHDKENKDNNVTKSRLEALQSRRKFFKRLGWGGINVLLFGGVIASLRFFYPRVLFEPPIRFKVGKPSEYPRDMVNNEYKEKYGIWIVRDKEGLFYCLSVKCTHLGCTPNWHEAQKKFKCPCHGSGFYKDGENFEGPAPRPLDRFKITLAGDGQLVVDKSVVYKGIAGMNSGEIYPQSLLKA